MTSDTTPTASLEAAHRLIAFYARRHPKVGRADVRDVYQEACCLFLAKFPYFDGIHLPLFCKWQVSAAVKSHRRNLRLRTQAITETFHEPVASPDVPFAEEDRAKEIARLRAAVDALPTGRRELIVRRFGLDGGPPATLKELRGGATTQAVSDRVKKVVGQLREMIEGSATVTQIVTVGVVFDNLAVSGSQARRKVANWWRKLQNYPSNYHK